MKFKNIETETAHMELYEKFGYFHINYGSNHVITMENIESTEELLSSFIAKYFD